MIQLDVSRYSGIEIVSLLALLIVIGFALFIFVGRALGFVVERLSRQNDSFLDDRRRIIRGKALRTRKERDLERLDEEALAQFIRDHPRDALASEIYCERLEKAERWADFAREFEYLLAIASELSLEEVCSDYNRLADLYIMRLGRPEKGREMLEAIIARYPQHYQATLARRRLEELRVFGVLPNQ